MEIIHVSAECYPVAKAGGLGDVVGALPKYQCKAGHYAKVVMPMYKTKFVAENEFIIDYKGKANLGSYFFDFTVFKEKYNKLGFDLFLVLIEGLTDRENIYSYSDDTERFMAFQIATLNWINQWQHLPDIIHCHDHHSALIPFMMQHCFAYKRLIDIPSVLTLHNAQYQGWMGWDKSFYIPEWDSWKAGLLDWKNMINPLACGIRCAWKVTTVSWTYMHELRQDSKGLEELFEYEKGKCIGILNGIDTEIWNPETDSYLKYHYNSDDVSNGKRWNKQALCKDYNLDSKVPLIIFIGRVVGEKAADVLPDAFATVLYNKPQQASFLIAGSGEPDIEWRLSEMNNRYPGYYHAEIGYNEGLAHKMYASADFLIMPSRVEPCGLNQLYSMRYGTVPMVRRTGGLLDTVTDMGDPEGFGILFNHANIEDIDYSIGRAISVYEDKKQMKWMRKHMMEIDHSWENTVQQYINLYQSLK